MNEQEDHPMEGGGPVLPELNIRVKTMDSMEHKINVKAGDTVNDLKKQIEDKLKIPSQRQRLIFQGKLLKEGTDLQSYKIQDMQVVHLVASAANHVPNQENVQQQNSPSSFLMPPPSIIAPGLGIPNSLLPANPIAAGNGLDLVQEITRTINETNFMRRNRRLIFQQNARQYLQQAVNLNMRESTEVIRQNAWQLRNLMDSRLTFEQAQIQNIPENGEIILSQFKEVQTYSMDKRKFFKGQWVDAKDTIEQWLEAQIVDIREHPIDQNGTTQTQLFVHYSGWGARWDEWLPLNSPRIAPFRTHTVQNPKDIYMSPHPNINPDSALLAREPEAYQTDQAGDQMTKMMDDLLGLLNHIYYENLYILSDILLLMIQQVLQKSLRKQELSQIKSLMACIQLRLQYFLLSQIFILNNQRPVSEEEEKRDPRLENSSLAEHFDEEQKQPGVFPQRPNQTDQNPRLVFQAAQLAPIVDRVGRLMIDFSPHLNNIVKQHHVRIREASSILNAGINGQISLGDAANIGAGVPGTLPNEPPQGNNHYRRLMNNSVSPYEQILNTIRSLNSISRDIVFGPSNPGAAGAGLNQSLQSQDLRMDSLQRQSVLPPERTIRIVQQVPIMHAPGEIAQIATFFDNRMFEENQDQNIEFHIHAFLSPPAVNSEPVPQSGSPSRQTSNAGTTARRLQDAQVGPSGLSEESPIQDNQSLQEELNRLLNRQTQTAQSPAPQQQWSGSQQSDFRPSSALRQSIDRNQESQPSNPFSSTQPFGVLYRPVGLFGPASPNEPTLMSPGGNQRPPIQQNPSPQIPQRQSTGPFGGIQPSQLNFNSTMQHPRVSGTMANRATTIRPILENRQPGAGSSQASHHHLNTQQLARAIRPQVASAANRNSLGSTQEANRILPPTEGFDHITVSIFLKVQDDSLPQWMIKKKSIKEKGDLTRGVPGLKVKKTAKTTPTAAEMQSLPKRREEEQKSSDDEDERMD